METKRILITGGTGSFGNALIDYLDKENVEFVVYSRDEKKQFDMFVNRKNSNIEYIVGDVRDKNKLIHSLRDIDYVFHAAALKHIPTGENFPEEVIKTNILGTKNVLEASEQCNVEKVIYLSTDKAVYPINAYGMSKALAEKIVSAHKGNTVCVSLRYGNVLGSRGSVVPLFLNFIKNNKPLTITNPNMTRFLLTLNEAVKLALKCLKDGKHGDLFVIKSPACSIKTLVEALELHFGKLEKKIIGIRPGEKIHETLLTVEEVHRAVTEKEDGIVYARIPKLDGSIRDYFFKGEEYKYLEPFTSENTIQFNSEQTLNKLKEAGLL
ncbi:MAG: UDP-glucose 4-epimerase [Deltaproteobacteria bacterium]|nr:MAG: UDP-glucose 4-epimerase [Deltaproteobacteria bacterium]RLG10854.1 MAG: UDP-glucose 4-epimerase [Candidatus Pacearchaeota archaeon]